MDPSERPNVVVHVGLPTVPVLVGMSLPSRDDAIETLFPEFASGYSWYEIASFPDSRYNCMAFAMGDTRKRWSPTKDSNEGEVYWPLELMDDHVANFLAVFELEGYQQCEHGEPEDGFDKVALFINEWGDVSHVAFQPGGTDHWLSKLGKWHDIRHEKVDAVSGRLYGWPDVFLSRPA